MCEGKEGKLLVYVRVWREGPGVQEDLMNLFASPSHASMEIDIKR